jgi:hypothetical protein
MRLISKIATIFSPSLYLRSLSAIYNASQELSHSELLNKLIFNYLINKEYLEYNAK